MLQETRTDQILMEHPYPNVAEYHSYIIKDNHIISLYFTRYHQTLVGRIYHDSRPFNTLGRLQKIENGTRHLHTLGIVHNGVNPSHVMFTIDDTAVIVDFN